MASDNKHTKFHAIVGSIKDNIVENSMRPFQRAKESGQIVCSVCYDSKKSVFFNKTGTLQHFLGCHKRPVNLRMRRSQENFPSRLIKTVNEFRLAFEKDSKEYKMASSGGALTVNGQREKEAATLAGLCLKTKGTLRSIGKKILFQSKYVKRET